MPNKVTYTITTADGKEHQVSKENVDKYGIQSYADAYKGATIRMRDAQKGDYDIPLQHFDNARKQGLHAFSLEHTPVQKQAAPKPTPTSSVTTAATPQDIVQSPRPQSQKDRPMTAVEKASMISNVGNIVNTTQAGLQRTKNMMTYAKSKAGLHVEPVKLGKKNNVVETAKQYNPKTGKMQSHYLTEAGNEYDDKMQADIEQAAIDDQKRRELDPVQSQLEDAYSERDRLEEAVSARRKELEDEYNNRPWYQRILTEMGKASHSNVDPAAISTDPEHMGFAQDEQYMQLMSAIRKNHQTIQTLEDKKNGQMNSFWHSLGTTLANGYIFADGLPEMRDATAILNAQKHIDSINRKRKTGQALTKEEAAAEAVLHNTQTDNVVQGTYGSEYGAWARAGRGTAYSADFMKDFLLFPAAANIAKGVAGKVAGIGGKYLAKEAGETAVKATAKAIARATLKATGVVVGAHTAGAVISNTTGIGRTVAKMGQLSAGDVSMDKNGNYKMENQQDLMSAFVEAEREQARENGSEMFGEFIPGGKVLSGAAKKALSKIGLGRISDMLTSIGNKAWYKNYTTLLEKGGYNGIPGEALEEYEGMFFDAITGHTDEGVRDFTDPKQQVDIWLGCATMGALMGAVPMGLHIQGYYRYKQGMNKADRTADFRLTPKRWQPLKEQIDQTDNGNMAGFVVNNILNNKSLEPQEKEAAMNYVRNLTKFRGFNIAQVNNVDDEVKDTQIESRQQNEAYSMGYNLQDEKELNNTAILYDEAKKQATKATGWNEDTLESMIGEDGGVSTLAYMKHSDEFNDGQLQAFIDYANARAAYNGMIQRVKDDIDTKVHESELVVDQRTNLDTGAIHPATMKVGDRQVYIVNGNVVMLPDGSGVDHEHSDDFVVLRDAETGELETADPSAIFKVDAPINVQEEKEVAADNIRQTFAQQQADKIDGKLEFKQGDTYSIIDKEDGAQHSLSIIGDAIDEKTGQVNPEMVLVDIDGAQQPILLPKEQVQQQVDEARRAAVAATQVVENAPTTNTNNTYSINDEVTLSDENGNAVRGSITAPENEDGKFEVYTEQPINGKKVNLFSAEELDAITKAPETVAENATVQQPQQQEETEESVEKETPKQQPTALERIPKDESGQPLYEQAEPETAWDAIVEQTEGDTSMAQTVADDMVSDLEAGVKKAEKTKTKSGGSIAEKIAAEKERAAVIEQAKATLAHWRKIAAVNRMREAAIQAEEQRKANEVARIRKEQEEKERVEQEEAERIKRESLNGVPDFVEDKATDARARGYRRVNGDKVDRQEAIDATIGKEVQVKFDDDNIPTGHVAIIEANQLQPSHKNGQRNPQHFIDEAQPKERKDDASVGAARKIAANIRPEEITSSVTAYTGAPTVNSRGEVIQGNNRSAALREMWDNHQEQGDKYKQYLIDNAESFGLKAEDIAAMDKPVLVNMLDVKDDEAISLGQFVASDTESGGTERIKPKNVVKKLGDKMKNFANILLRANDENISFAELVDSNGVDALKWLNANGVISPTQYKSAFDSKGNITAEAKNDIKGIMYQSIFEGGNTQLEEMFNALPAKAQKAILATAYRDYDSPQSERMIGDIQDSIMAYYALSHDSMFMNAKNHKDARIAVEAWRRQLAFDDVTGESYLPAEKYSNFALLLVTMYKGDNQSLIQGTFNKMYDLIQGTQEETLFEQPDNTPRSLAQAIKETLNIEYNGQQGSNVLAGDNSASQEGRTGSNGDTTPRGRSEDINGAEANQGGTERDTGRSGSEQSSGGSQEEVAAENSHLTKKEAADFIAQMELGADVAQEIPLTIENWDKEFGEDGIVSTPIGDVKMGENQFAKLMRAGRNGKLGMLKPTLEYPDAIVEENSKAKEGTHTERPSSFIFIKSFRKSDGTRYYYFTSITVSVDGKEVVVSNQEKSRNRILRLLMEGSVIWRTPKDATTSSAEKQGLDYVHPDKAEGETKGSVITPQNTSSVGKDSKQSDTKQEKSEETAKKDAVSEDLFAKAERVAEEDKAKRTRKKEEAKVDTNPTDAQKEAGNYKKGHIKVDGFNVTIEQPKGSIRRGKDANGKEWESEMHNTYGYIRGTESVDGDHIDIFLSDNPTEGNVFVVDQVNKDGSFDEHKVMYGFSDMESARKAYLSNYEEGWQGLGNITEVSKEEFKKWIDSSKRKTKPFAEYSTVKTQGDVQTKKPTETEDFARQDLKELEDFQKNTDTTGRTTIDVDRYEAEDLFAPLLLDGKTSRLGVLTVVPDKITDPSGQIAVYDYSDEIDEKTNSGWQKWGDLTDEYNKTVDSSDKAQERGDTATLGFTSVDAALKFYDWLNTDGHEYQENGLLQYSTEDLTNNTIAKRLATDTILSALNKAGIEVVRATDEQAQELLANTHATSLRTPQGTIYGWAVDGKIYLTEAGINPDTPIHEYTHLWAEAMMSKNKQGWNNIKTLLKGTSVWEEVVSDSNYSNITNNEDAVASEVLSRISGRENAARMESEAQKVIDENKDVFEKAKSVTLLNRIKRALDMFWKWVGKELFKIKKFGSINEVTDRVLYDLMHSTKLNSNDKSLIGVHNISEQKLRKVLKQGGFANPSIAVIDTDKQVHNDYGEISLILPSRKINKSTGKNAGTFEGDAWTPMYPVVEKQISSDGGITIHNDINAVPKDMQSEVRNALNRWLENGSDTDLSYLYLFQQGKAPQMIVEKPKYSNEVYKTLNDIMFGVNSVYNLSKNEIKKLVELYIQTELDGNIKEYNEAIQRKKSKYEELIKRSKPNSLQYRVADSYLEDIEKYGYPLSPLINFVNDVQRDKIKQGSKNAQKTLNTASQIIKDAGLEKDFKNWVEGLNNRYQAKEVIFDGFTPTGKRRYIPNTLENVSKIMKKQGRQASAGISISFSNFAASVMKANGSLDNIRKKKSKLTNEHKDIEDFEEKWKEVYFDLAMKLQPNANMFDDYGFARLQEAANEKNPQTYIRNVYGITLSEEDVQKLQDLVEAIREERPALYFETKFERPVILNEFSKAVVPEDLSDDLKKTLRDNGVEVFTYKRGDVEERQKVTQEAAYSSNDIAFQVIDNSRDGNNTDRFTDGLNAVNEQFNRELAGLTEENADTKIFNLGNPSSILLSAGVEDKPMKLYGSKLMKKAKLHGFSPKELQSLPAALTDPIAVFDNYKKTDNRSILTELKTKDGNFLVSLTIGKGIDVDFNIIASAFGKANDSIVKWINKGFATYINKEKALNYLYFSESSISEATDNVGQEDSTNLYLSAPIAEAAENSELSSAAKIVKDFVNPVIKDENLLRDGAGNLSDDELSMNHDPVAKMLGKNNRTEEDHKASAERERQRMISRISELADKLHLDNIETVTDSNSLQGKKAKAKGFYSKSSGKITIVIPNHASVEDVEKTLLHEAVAHYGLRKLFGEHFETFLDNVYQNVEPEIRRIITSQAANNNWYFRTATEEYLAGLAERTDFERVHYAIWNKIKSLFLKMLHSIGFEGWSATELSDNELRYLLWRSYENMKEPGRYRSILGEAEDIAKQNELKVGNYDQQKTNSSNVAERGILYREDDSKEKERVNAREKYEQRINRAMFQTQEALQDSMLGLKEAMNAITKAEGKNVNIEDIDGYENAYLGENRLSSVNKAEADAFAHLLFKPMLAEVSKLCKNVQERAELVDYMMAKHGLERNAVMRKRAIEDILNNEKLSDAQKSARAGLAEYRDYAGLTALTGKDNVTEAEVDAETMVSEYENTHDTTNLWDKVNAVNAAILSKSYECGMMDKDTYEKISDMYKYYIPLRGFDETTSEEAYAYLLQQSSAFNAPIKVAKGRSSKADDPFANMQSMAESAITQGNRNKLVKQRFFNFVLNHPSDLVSISDMWLKYDDVADEWKPVFPDNFEENDSAEDIEQKLKEFEDKMKKLSEQAPNKYKHGKETANIPYRVVDSRDLRQHQVLVKRGGRDYILTLNGNPRAAQALNGQTNPDNDTSGAIGAILKAGEMVNRQLSAFYTTRNPDFVVSNFIRDMLFSNSIVWVKESPNYALRFHRNIARCNPAQIKVLLAKHRKGTLDMNNKLEHMFYQFMMNGGETGYANVRDIEQHKNDIRRELKRANGKLSITKALNLLGEKLDEYNRAVENCARFAAYLTSREMGRTVERSIYDAKEISVNFNKKGSGAKFMNAVGQTKIGTASAFVSGIGRSGFVFWNAAIQGTTNFGRQFKKHPAKAFTASAIMFLLGAVIAGIGMGDGDDDADANSYWNLPEYVRRSNILFKTGDQWVSIPLPVEYRAIYGMGELMVSAMSGKEHFTGTELGKAIAGQATQVLPIDFLEGGGGVKAFVPSAIKPFAEVYSNKGWTGMPIYKDTPYNKYMPEWTKAYKSANKYLVGIAKTLNESTGGDAYTKGSVDINPAQIEYLLNGYFGGVSGTIDKLSKSAETIAGDREYDPRNFLLLNRILKNGDERTEARAINNEYMRVKEEHDVLKARMKHYENDTDKGLFDYADKIDFLYNSPEFARYEIFEDYSKDIDALYQELKEANDGAEHLSIEKELTELKKEMIEEMNKTRK